MHAELILTFKSGVFQYSICLNTGERYDNRNQQRMKAKVKLIKKEDRNSPASPVVSEASADPKEWSTAVKSWVKEFQEDRREGSLEAFDSLFSDPKP